MCTHAADARAADHDKLQPATANPCGIEQSAGWHRELAEKARRIARDTTSERDRRDLIALAEKEEAIASEMEARHARG